MKLIKINDVESVKIYFMSYSYEIETTSLIDKKVRQYP